MPGRGTVQRQAVDPAVFKRWTILYPCYVNVMLTTAQGRRLPKSKLAGCM
jgi:hypothetical protein